jgi:hypothetical protein
MQEPLFEMRSLVHRQIISQLATCTVYLNVQLVLTRTEGARHLVLISFFNSFFIQSGASSALKLTSRETEKLGQFVRSSKATRFPRIRLVTKNTFGTERRTPGEERPALHLPRPIFLPGKTKEKTLFTAFLKMVSEVSIL